VPALRLADDASAGRTWCRTDPVFKIDGQVVDVWVASDVAMKTAATGPTKIALTVPVGCSASVIAKDLGFGYGYAISIATSSTLQKTATSTPVVVAVTVPSKDGSLPVVVEQTPRTAGPVKAGTAQGLANRVVTLRTG
jgi:hypothetical protein